MLDKWCWDAVEKSCMNYSCMNHEFLTLVVAENQSSLQFPLWPSNILRMDGWMQRRLWDCTSWIQCKRAVLWGLESTGVLELLHGCRRTENIARYCSLQQRLVMRLHFERDRRRSQYIKKRRSHIFISTGLFTFSFWYLIEIVLVTQVYSKLKAGVLTYSWNGRWLLRH